MNFGDDRSWPGGQQEVERDVGYANTTPASFSLPGDYIPSGGAYDAFKIGTSQDDFTTYASDHAHGPELTNWLENLNPGEYMPAPFTNYSQGFAERMNYTASSTLFLPTSPPPPCHPSSRTSREGWSPEEDNFLVGKRKEGRGFSQIGQEMFAKYGVFRADNCLVKRLQKIQGQYLEPLPMAMKNRMPELLDILKDELDKLGLDGVSGDDKEVLDQVMQDLPRLLPKFVQNRVTNTRKALLNTSLSRT
ncbi:hypothetical protein QBC37DRAFT_387358 [Rhypophila decipiens]|uniref:Uncharacterized protein n=1 Tax=Rhypophila decipiens TaxID=261697 RepID=A0AAN7B8F3_9PEZI|nr:hypothetical protein QBC37DRAFT_387358 [Rhypophila decipiens]